MPVENEIKHVLSDPDGSLFQFLSDRHGVSTLDQFYVTPNARFRTSVSIGRIEDTGERGPVIRRQFTFKIEVGGRLLEIETDVSEQDVKLAEAAALERIVKKRVSFDRDDAHWDVDFLLTAPGEEGGVVRFVMAEAEFPEGGSYAIPDEIMPYLDFVVTKGFSAEFTNRNLADERHVERVMRVVAPRLREMTADMYPHRLSERSVAAPRG